MSDEVLDEVLTDKHLTLDFWNTPWYREHWDGVIEERPVVIADLCAAGLEVDVSGTVVNFFEYSPDNDAIWKKANPKYQKALGRFLMRRAVERLRAHCEINPATFTSAVIAEMLEVVSADDWTDIITFSGGSMTLDSDWMLDSLSCDDSPKKSTVTATWRKYGAWKLVDTANNELIP